MNRDEVLQDLHQVFMETFDLDDVTLTDATTALDIDNWDSLTHFHLVVEIGKKFNIRFNSSEIQNWKNVGEIVDSILSKL
jgi:acyl carrier protein